MNEKRKLYRKQLKEKKINELKRLGINHKTFNDKEIEYLKLSDLKKGIVPTEKKTSNYREELRNRKKKKLLDLGYGVEGQTKKTIDKIKISDINEKNFSPKKYPDFFNTKEKYSYTFDFDKDYKLKNNKALYIAFRDYSGENSIFDIISDFNNKSIDELLEAYRYIINLKPSFNKSKYRKSNGAFGTSNGRAGDYKWMVADKDVLLAEHNFTRNTNRRKRTRMRSGAHKGFQVIKDGKYIAHTHVCGRKLLVIFNSLMYNVMEELREPLYHRFIDFVKNYLPDMLKYL